MIWSFSEQRIFKKCPRQWFYKAVFADALAKDPARHEAYLLSKLLTVSAWRGMIVDSTIQDFIVPELNKGRRPTLGEASKYARRLFDRQLAFARSQRMREPGMTLKSAGDDMAAFFKLEYGEPIDESEYETAWRDVRDALRSLYRLDDVRQLVREGCKRIAQRVLMFDHCGAHVRAIPDLIVFYTDRPPLILDWKVHTFGIHDSADQLTTYALALTRANPHKDFVRPPGGWRATDVDLLEVQLLRGLVRRHRVEESDADATSERIAEGIVALQFACDGKRPSEMRAEDFPTAWNPRTCQSCRFRKLCWNSQS